MKHCPKCNRNYDDNTLRFCLEDGTPLSISSRDSDPPPTEILTNSPTVPAIKPTIKSTDPTIPSYLGAQPFHSDRSEDRRQTNPLLTAGVIAIALLLLALVGIAAYFVLRQPNGTESAKADKSASSPAVRESPTNKTAEKNDKPAAGEEIASSNPQTGTPLKITASASSVRLAVQSNTYYPSNAIDGKRTTAWIEGVDGPGLGEWIRFDFDREINLHRILFQPGYFKSPQIWAENNRLAGITAQFSDGTSRELTFDNRMDSQKADIGSVRTRWVRFVIKSVYYGTDPDTALSEVAFEWDQ